MRQAFVLAFCLGLPSSTFAALGYGPFFGVKASWPQYVAGSLSFMSMEKKLGVYKPYFQIEPGLAGMKTSVGFGSVVGPSIFSSKRLKIAYLNIWALSNEEWPSKYGYLGPEIEFMALLPSVHFGVFQPLDQGVDISKWKYALGVGVGF
jgi:hypothetical protein